jgi:subtilisin family serine protease
LSKVVEAAVALARRGIDVLNLSLGAFADEPNAQVVMGELVDHLLQIGRDRGKDIAIVAAAGNLDDNRHPGVFWPAALPNVLALGAVEGPDSVRLAPWSNRGDWLDLAAPGKDLLSTYIDGELRPDTLPKPIPYDGWAIWSGTSFAAAVVSGAIAQLMTTGPAGQISAAQAANKLRGGEMATCWTERDGDVPAVPVVPLRTWDDQQAAREAVAATSTLYEMTRPTDQA